MILMNWTRSDGGGFTAFQVRVSRAKLARFVHRQFVGHMQAIYCHELAALAICRALAANTDDLARRDAFLRLAEIEARQLARRAEMLQRLDAQVPCKCDTLPRRLWRHLLVWMGPRCALAWIRHVKLGDVRRQLALANLLKDFGQ